MGKLKIRKPKPKRRKIFRRRQVKMYITDCLKEQTVVMKKDLGTI